MPSESLTCEAISRSVLGQPASSRAAELFYHCPRHDDQHPSLQINVEKNVWLCGPCSASGNAWQLAAFLAGCDASDKDGVKSWLKTHGLSSSPQKGRFSNADRRIVATYPYTDQQGTLLYEKLRYEPKVFSVRRPDGQGGWLWGLGGISPVLYNLPEVVKATEVFYVEGEKDVETARGLGLTATTSGSVANWRKELAHLLGGRRICIIPDADAPGQKHGRQVATDLLGVASSVRLLELPGAKDLTEWVEGGGNTEALRRLAEKATTVTALTIAAWASESKDPAALQLVTVGALLAEPDEPVRWLLEPHLPAAGLSLLASKPKVGKSTWARCLALAVARGQSFMDCATQQGSVIYLALEEKRGELREHFRAMGVADEPILIHVAHAPKGALRQLRMLAQERKPALIIVDPLLKLARVKDANDYAQMTEALEPLLILARETGAHVLVVHHVGKNERREATDAILGSTALFGGVDTALIMKRSDRYRTIQSVQRYGTDLPETVLEYHQESRTLSRGAEKTQADLDRIANAILDHLTLQHEPLPEEQILCEIEGRQAQKRAALRDLFQVGRISRTGGGKRGDPYLYSAAAESSYPRTQHIQGTRVRETGSGPQLVESRTAILVPESSQEGPLEPDNAVRESAPRQVPGWEVL